MKVANFIGKLGEDFAVTYLQEKGYKIIERNFRKRYGEIDIISTKDGILVFVEVKTRKSSRFGTPLESITPWKLRELIHTAQLYAMANPRLPKSLRIDAISILLNSDNKISTIEHVENISYL